MLYYSILYRIILHGDKEHWDFLRALPVKEGLMRTDSVKLMYTPIYNILLLLIIIMMIMIMMIIMIIIVMIMIILVKGRLSERVWNPRSLMRPVYT